MLAPKSAESLDGSSSSSCSSSALGRARALTAPVPRSSVAGEYEDHEWWEEHSSLLREAWREWGPRHAALYDTEGDAYEQHGLIDPDLVEAVRSRDPPSRLRALCRATNAPNVYRVKFLTPKFVRLLREELEHVEESGIPLRRPNGMNRYGAILDDLGLEEAMSHLVDRYVRPLASIMFPNYVGPKDLDEIYPFVVQYRPGQDVQLNEHTDASTVTINVCLQPSMSQNASSVSPLYFKGYSYDYGPLAANQSKDHAPSYYKDAAAQHVELSEPGEALLHLGGQLHGVTPVSGERSNLVIWMFGQYGYVRITPYNEEEIKHNQRDIYKRHGWSTTKNSCQDDVLMGL